MFYTKLSATKVDVKYVESKIDINLTTVSISMANTLIAFSIITDNGSHYHKYTGRKNGSYHGSLQLSVKFNDKQNMITIKKNVKSIKIKFHNAEDYDNIKKKVIYYKLMSQNDHSIQF